MMFIRSVLLVIFTILQTSALYSQTPSYYHYTSSNGLASSTVFQIIQDKEGFTWFATLNGISRFDGKNFTSLGINEGLNSNAIISLAEAKNGALFIGSYEKGINKLKNGKIENYFNHNNGKQFLISYLLLDSSGKNQQKLYAYRNGSDINIIENKSNSKQSCQTISINPLHLIKLEQLPNGEIVALTKTGLYKLRNNKLVKLQIKGLPDVAVNCLSSDKDGSYFIGTEGMIYKIKNETVVKQYKINLFTKKNDVIGILWDKNHNLWFSIMNKGFFLIQNNTEKSIDVGSKMNLQNTLVNNFLEDNEGNIWISTYGKGVYCLNNLFLKSYNENDGMSSNNVYSMMLPKKRTTFCLNLR